VLTPDEIARDVCYLETVGRVSGRRRVVELWFATVGATIYFLSGGRDAANWVRNIRANPAARIRIGGRTYAGRGRIVTEAEEDASARRLLAAKYQGWHEHRPLSSWARTSLPVAVELEVRSE
jgi:deazaflavin-dependent oxidoreductase (nitroreductase family)